MTTNQSKLNLPEDDTTSRGTLLTVLAVFTPIFLLFLALFTGVLNP